MPFDVGIARNFFPPADPNWSIEILGAPDCAAGSPFGGVPDRLKRHDPYRDGIRS